MAYLPETQRILDLFERHGDEAYGEQLTQSSHAIQAALLARAAGYDDELILAAWLHDIGHLAPQEQDTEYMTMGDFGVEAHDKWGDALLRELGCSERLLAPVRNHVDAKRYLCRVEPGYYAALSDASKATLAYQGGPMEEQEAARFRQDPYFKESIALRRIDEEAKETDFVINDGQWSKLADLLDGYLRARQVVEVDK